MDAARWEEEQEHFHRLVDRPHAEQVAELDALSAVNAQLAAGVRALLHADATGDALLSRDPRTVFHEVLGETASLPTTPFGPYQLTALLGEGGMGVVYLGKRADLGAHAAIKVLRDAWVSPSRRDRFLFEQRTLVSLEHPGIARLLDADSLADGTPWFAMEYVEGEPITQHCRERSLSLSQRLSLFRQACEAVRFAHERGVIHRDIKPGNVLVGRDSNVKLLDFGIAKSTGTDEHAAHETRTQHRMLTPAYASPEQLRGESVGVQADVYALGVVLFELLTGQRPHDVDGLSSLETARRIETQPAPRVSVIIRKAGAGALLARLGQSAIDDLDALVSCALHADAQRRYRSADALLRDLERYEHQQPIAAQPDSVQYRARKFLTRRWREVAVAAAVFVIAISGALSYTIRINSARAAAEAETARVRRLRDLLVAMFDGGDEDAGPSNALRVTDLVDNGIRESQGLEKDPALQAEMFSVLGNASSKLGRTEQADTLLQRAFAIKQRLFGATGRETIEAQVALAAHDMGAGRAERARVSLREAYRLATASLSRTDPIRASTVEAMGAALAEFDSTTVAIPILEEAVALRALESSSTLPYIDALSALANGYFYDGQRAKAESLNVVVMERTKALLGAEHPSVALNLMNLALIARDDGRTADFERYSREALAIFERSFGSDHFRTAAALRNVGTALELQDKDAEAIPLLRRALAIQEKTLGSETAPVAVTLNSLASAEIGAGHFDRGIDLYARAIGIYRTMYGDRHSSTLVARANLGSELLRGQRTDTAAALLTDVVRIAASALDSTDYNLAVFRLRLGRVRLAQKRYQDVIAQSVRGLRGIELNTSGPTSYSRAARKDLHVAYLALGDSANAKRFADPEGRMDQPGQGAVVTPPKVP